MAGGSFRTVGGSFRTAGGSAFRTAVGSLRMASGSFRTAPGSFRTAPGSFRTAVGSFRTAAGSFGTAAGSFRTAAGSFRTAVGSSKTAAVSSKTTVRLLQDDVGFPPGTTVGSSQDGSRLLQDDGPVPPATGSSRTAFIALHGQLSSAAGPPHRRPAPRVFHHERQVHALEDCRPRRCVFARGVRGRARRQPPPPGIAKEVMSVAPSPSILVRGHWQWRGSICGPGPIEGGAPPERGLGGRSLALELGRQLGLDGGGAGRRDDALIEGRATAWRRRSAPTVLPSGRPRGVHRRGARREQLRRRSLQRGSGRALLRAPAPGLLPGLRHPGCRAEPRPDGDVGPPRARFAVRAHGERASCARETKARSPPSTNAWWACPGPSPAPCRGIREDVHRERLRSCSPKRPPRPQRGARSKNRSKIAAEYPFGRFVHPSAGEVGEGVDTPRCASQS